MFYSVIVVKKFFLSIAMKEAAASGCCHKWNMLALYQLPFKQQLGRPFGDRKALNLERQYPSNNRCPSVRTYVGTHYSTRKTKEEPLQRRITKKAEMNTTLVLSGHTWELCNKTRLYITDKGKDSYGHYMNRTKQDEAAGGMFADQASRLCNRCAVPGTGPPKVWERESEKLENNTTIRYT